MADGFVCTRCGLCCQHLDLNLLYADLDRGDGVCRHYLSATQSCGIYDERPLKCRIDESYVFFAHLMTLTDYHDINSKSCKSLQNRCS